MTSTRITTHSAEETEKLAQRIAAQLTPGTFIALEGDLGAGKTVFARGLARGLGITRDILSPTFTLLRQYEDGRLPLYHFDIYRLDSEDELDDAGFYDSALAGGVTICEWAQKFPDALPEGRIEISIEATGPEDRMITITDHPGRQGANNRRR